MNLCLYQQSCILHCVTLYFKRVDNQLVLLSLFRTDNLYYADTSECPKGVPIIMTGFTGSEVGFNDNKLSFA